MTIHLALIQIRTSGTNEIIRLLLVMTKKLLLVMTKKEGQTQSRMNTQVIEKKYNQLSCFTSRRIILHNPWGVTLLEWKSPPISIRAPALSFYLLPYIYVHYWPKMRKSREVTLSLKPDHMVYPFYYRGISSSPFFTEVFRCKSVSSFYSARIYCMRSPRIAISSYIWIVISASCKWKYLWVGYPYRGSCLLDGGSRYHATLRYVTKGYDRRSPWWSREKLIKFSRFLSFLLV